MAQNYCLSNTIVSIIFGLLIGITLTYTIFKEILSTNLSEPKPFGDEDIRKTLFDDIDEQKIGSLIKEMTELTQTKELEGMETQTLFIYNFWSNLGLKTSFANYTVLISHPNLEKPNLVTIYDKNGEILHKCQLNSLDSNEIHNYLSYSRSTDIPVNGTPIYVNFGRYEDFEELAKIGISVDRHIVIAKYSNIPPRDILKMAEEKGALALIMFEDKSLEDNQMRDNKNVRIDNLYAGRGDPQTPFYPSKDYSYKLKNSELKLSKISSQSISYSDAIQILKGLKGVALPQNWTINDDISSVGPDYSDGNYLSLEVNTIFKPTLIHNVIGVIEGCIEKDRYVIVGSGHSMHSTVALMVLSKAFIKTMKIKKWCPQRSLLFCNWGPQEYRSIGLTEWFEENRILLEKGAVAYLNADIDIRGNFTFYANSVPILYQTIYDAIKVVDNPNIEEVKNGLKSVYKSYEIKRPSDVISEPQIGFQFLNTPFIQISGIPVLQYYYDCDQRIQTFCQTFSDKTLISFDTNFEFSTTLLKAFVETLRLISDRPLLPFRESLYNYYYILYHNLEKINPLLPNELNLTQLDDTLSDFFRAMIIRRTAEVDEQNELMVRRFNDILMNLEKTFISNFEGILHNMDQKHVLYAPNPYNSNQYQIFPGLMRLLSTYSQESNETIKNKTIEEFRRHISVIIFHLKSAEHLLKQTFNQTLNIN